jgi:TolA-binding protein
MVSARRYWKVHRGANWFLRSEDVPRRLNPIKLNRVMKRLLESGGTSFEGALLHAVASERPSADLELRMRLALGLDPTPPVLPEVAPAPAMKAASVAASHPMALAGLVAAGLIAGASLGHRYSSQVTPVDRDARPAAHVSAPTAAEVVDPRAEPASEGLRPVPLDALPRSPAPGSNAKAASNVLSEEMRLIDSARAHVAAGDAKKALGVLGSYDRRFPRGALRQEAAVLRVEALEKSGNEKRAAELAKKFVSEHPNSPHVERVQNLAR